MQAPLFNCICQVDIEESKRCYIIVKVTYGVNTKSNTFTRSYRLTDFQKLLT